MSNSGKEKWQFTPFLGGLKPVCSDGLRAGTMESHNFCVLGPILVKFHIQAQLIESFPMTYVFRNSDEESCSSHLFGVVPSQAAQTAFLPELLKDITFCLTSYPGEISYSNSANRELFYDISVLVVRQRKVALHTISHLTPTEA